jgi:phosphatidate cytidylyltransferase
VSIKRFITGSVMFIFIVPLISMQALLPLFEVVMVLFVLGAINEFLSMFEKKDVLTKNFKRIVTLMTLSTYLALVGFMGFNQSEASIVQLELIHIMISILIVLLFIYFVMSKNFTVEHIGKALLVIIYVAFGAASITSVRFIGVRFITYMFLISLLTDTSAYVIGVKFGKHKMAPTVSPKKSWEGAIGGTIAATIFASLFAMYYGRLFPATTFLGNIFNSSGQQTILDRIVLDEPLSMSLQVVIIVVMTFTASIVSQFGDLMASKLKRHFEIKDFGNIFPGHGGIMDRFDSVLLVSLYVFSILNLIMILN